MDAYTSFAEVYDMFMDNIPYEDWCGYLTSLLKEYGINDGLVLDLGCGTGTLTELLAKEGYDMIGVDVSEDMLQEAIEKRAESGLPILYLLQDMREFELYGTVRAVVSICDSLNYSIPGHLRVLFQLFLQTGRKIAMMGVLASEGDCAVGESFRCMAVIFASAI